MIICPSCRENISEFSYKREYKSKFVNYSHRLYHCNNCDLEFWVPLEFVKQIYEEEIIEEYSSWHKGEELFLSDNHKSFIEYIISKGIKSGKLLDVGCGNGAFISYMKNLGFEVWGIDIDSKSIKIAKEIFKLENVYNFSLEEFLNYANKNNIKFDVITFFEVLEHQPKPLEFLENIKKLLSEKGIVAGSVPNRNRLFAELTRKNSDYDFPPHHFLWFSYKSLKLMFEKVNFSVEVFPVKVINYMSTDRILNYLEKLGIKSKFVKKLIRFPVSILSFFIRSVYNISGGLGIMFVGKMKSN